MTSAQIEAVGEGSYLVNALADCGKCHGAAGSIPGFLAGVTVQGSFNARNLTPDATTGLRLTETQFVDTMRTGTNYTCSGSTCTASTTATMKVMPWTDYRGPRHLISRRSTLAAGAPPSVPVSAGTAQIGRGSYLIDSFGQCRGCHSKSSTNAAQWLTGGKVFT